MTTGSLAAAQRRPTIGVTGTNGKTSTVWMIAHALLGRDPALAWICTLGSFVGTTRVDAASTYDGFRQTMATSRSRGGTLAVLELTSQALAQGFASHWPADVGVFTNFSHDHLDLHPSVEHYLASKAQLFLHLPAGGTAVLNGRDPASDHLQNVLPPTVRVLRYGEAGPGPDVLALRSVDEYEDRTELTAVLPNGRVLHVRTRFVGKPFAENTLAAMAALLAWGMEPDDVADRLAAIEPPPGRFQWIAKKPSVVVDFAHSPVALERMVGVAKRLCRGRLTVVFGAGGGRDPSKRPAMGAAVVAADRIILTSDNPRDEDPAAIAADLARGMPHGRAVVELDRGRAITEAILNAADDDFVLIAGKGHEQSQWIRGEAVPFSDAACARTAVVERTDRAGQRRNRT